MTLNSDQTQPTSDAALRIPKPPMERPISGSRDHRRRPSTKPGKHTDQEWYLLAELMRVDEAMQELVTERTALLKALAHERERHTRELAARRRNASLRILIEIAVLAALRRTDTATLYADELFDRLKLGSPALNPSTFRSVLHRMKAKNLIAPSPQKRGLWILAPLATRQRGD